ncbi:hypothetical protein ACWGDX_05330 [Streptomyces sp. NPDC055025]
MRIAEALADDLRAHGGVLHTGHRVTRLAELDARVITLDTTPRGLLELAGDRLPPRYRPAAAYETYETYDPNHPGGDIGVGAVTLTRSLFRRQCRPAPGVRHDYRPAPGARGRVPSAISVITVVRGGLGSPGRGLCATMYRGAHSEHTV